MQDVMIDLETMGQGPDAAIVAIGAIEFDRETREIGEKFYLTVDLESAVRLGGVMDPSTVMWWMRQSEHARQALDGKTDIATALARFSGWLRGRADLGQVRIWGNGSDFDNVILSSAYKRLLLPTPWKFWNNRCYRTWKNEHHDVPMVRGGTHHNALDDAVSQAKHVLCVPFEMPPAA